MLPSRFNVAGISNTLGRSVGGCLANLSWVNYLHLNNVTLLVAGCATLLIGTLVTSFPTLVTYAVVLGFCLGTPFIQFVFLSLCVVTNNSNTDFKKEKKIMSVFFISKSPPAKIRILFKKPPPHTINQNSERKNTQNKYRESFYLCLKN